MTENTNSQVDTKILSETDVLIFQKGKELHELCCQNKRMSMIMIDVENKCDGHSYLLYNLANERYDISNQDGHVKSFQLFMYTVAVLIDKLTSGRFSITSKKNE